jgi:hypothetical protein
MNSSHFETRMLVVLHDRPVWLGKADSSQNRSPMANNGWFASSVLDEKNAMIYFCWNEVCQFFFYLDCLSPCADEIRRFIDLGGELTPTKYYYGEY